MQAAVAAQELVKRYPKCPTTAVDGLSFSVAPGEVFGLLGPHGAPKTTIIGILTTRVRPTSGVARTGGVDVATDPAGACSRLGVLPQRSNLDRSLTARQNLIFHAAEAAWAEPSGRGGPTSCWSSTAWVGVAATRWTATPVVLSTHDMEDAAELSCRVGIVDHGVLLALGTPGELTRSLEGGASLDLTASYAAGDTADEVVAALGAVDGVHRAEAVGAAGDAPGPGEVRVRLALSVDPASLVAPVRWTT